jgi:hypothetical protein
MFWQIVENGTRQSKFSAARPVNADQWPRSTDIGSFVRADGAGHLASSRGLPNPIFWEDFNDRNTPKYLK